MDIQLWIEFFIRAFAGVFVILDPIGGTTHFLALTSQDSEVGKKNVARRACIAAFSILIFFSFAGGALFRYFGITLAALKIAGGVLLFTVALSMLYGKRSGIKTTPEEEQEHNELQEVAIIPLAMPILSGPGAITTVMVFASEAKTVERLLALVVAISLSVIIAYLVFVNSTLIQNVLKQSGIKVLTRIMGLIMAVISVQFVINGITDVIPFLMMRNI